MPLRYRETPADSWKPINANTYEFIAPISTSSYSAVRVLAHTCMTEYPPIPGYGYAYERQLSSVAGSVNGIVTHYQLREYGEYRASYNGSDTETFVGVQIKIFTLEEPHGGEWRLLKGAGSYPYLLPGMAGNNNLEITFFPLGSIPVYNNSPCILRAYLEGVLVFNQLFDGCPYVEVIDQPVCPPDTCEVDCGTYVCCYGSDGISVFNFNK